MQYRYLCNLMNSLLTLRRPRGSRNLTEGRKAAIATLGKVNMLTYPQIASNWAA
jgi:hypothetical protein